MDKRKIQFVLGAIALSWGVSIVRMYINMKSSVTEFEATLPELPQLTFHNMFTYLFQ